MEEGVTVIFSPDLKESEGFRLAVRSVPRRSKHGEEHKHLPGPVGEVVGERAL